MEAYNYMDAVTADVIEWIKENGIKVTAENREEIEERLRDELWTADSVTGNGSGSYTFDFQKAAEYVCQNLYLLADAIKEFGGSVDVLEQGIEACDVTIRCYLLPQAIAAALDQVEEAEAEAEE